MYFTMFPIIVLSHIRLQDIIVCVLRAANKLNFQRTVHELFNVKFVCICSFNK
ncbi:hypothetical protein HanRHA438_Chr05g0202961 [Helianthus annuus]|nr:hypothetical protein HanRHA438_Chr05g0202961 [Helianthus annuus]